MAMSRKNYVAVAAANEFLFDVLCTALEGGIGYWSQCGNIKYANREGSTIRDYVSCDLVRAEGGDWEEDGIDGVPAGKRLKLDRTVIARGIQRILQGDVKIHASIADHIRQGAVSNDASHIDADAADCIVQAGLFNELVYG